MKIRQVTGVFNVGVRYNGFEAQAEKESELVEMAYDYIEDDPDYSKTEQYDFHLFTDDDQFIGEFAIAGGM